MLIKILQNIFSAIIVLTGIYSFWSEPDGLRALFGILFIIVGFLNIVVINETSSILSTIAALISDFLILLVFYAQLTDYDVKEYFLLHLILWTPFGFLFVSLLYNIIRITYKRIH